LSFNKKEGKMKKILALLFAIAMVFLAIGYAQASTINLAGTIRDFKISHPDFEYVIAFDPGIVQSTLGLDKKPVYAGLAGNPTTTGQANFDQWYRDVPGVNLSTSHTITLDNTITADPNVYTFSDPSFFPIDGLLWGNEGNPHNYHFTFEIHSSFTYQGGEVFSFTGDDDVWVFINNTLAIDLGGVHSSMSASVSLDSLGLSTGNTYDLDFFFAERHTSQSNYRIDTSLELRPSAVPIPSAVWLLGSGLLGLVGIRRRYKS
jgi:fibro-slime domain-containing protein